MMIIIAILVVVSIFGVLGYNSLVKYKNWAQEAWAQIDVQLKRRNDLIPNLVETVKGYAKHESETLEKVVSARNQLVDSSQQSPQEVMDASNQLTGTLKTIFALSESYPELKANTNFLELQEELTNTENKIAYSRQLYNTNVTQYNTKLELIPTNIIAKLANFKPMTLLETPEEEKEVPKVSF